mgnify:CR=1 FL=1|jgi:hypothetical protein|tara:strand:+ start:249 stop:494 length:246 start_codon:yes stop_codon:yes gene_type:complete
MKAYRIQARVGGKYINEVLTANSDLDALNKFSTKVSSGKVVLIDEDFYNKNHTYITYEELNESREETSVNRATELGNTVVK